MRTLLFGALGVVIGALGGCVVPVVVGYVLGWSTNEPGGDNHAFSLMIFLCVPAGALVGMVMGCCYGSRDGP